MINAFRIGDSKTYRHEVSSSDLAIFGDQQVHPVYATFALGRDAEWCCRLFVLEMKEEEEEGIGTFLHINHHSPALLGQTVEFVAEVKSLQANEIICSYEAKVGDRLIASGEQGQKILKKEKIERLFQSL
jgi:predicted thioesterase